jgi:hypothetical protein
MISTPCQDIERRAAWHITGSPLLWAFVDTAVIFGALGWLYVAAVAIVNPDELSSAIVSWIPIRRDTLGMVCFGLSAVAYFVHGVRKPSVTNGSFTLHGRKSLTSEPFSPTPR